MISDQEQYGSVLPARHVVRSIRPAAFPTRDELSFAPPVVRPFQFPSAEHFEERVRAVIARVADVERLQPKTVEWLGRGYRSFRPFLNEGGYDNAFFSGDPTRQIETLVQWRASLLARGVGRVSVRTYWSAMKALCRRIAAQDGVMNPFDWIAPPRVGRVLPKSLTRDAARAVLEFVENYPWRTSFVRQRNIAVVATMLLSGLRSGEVTRLLAEDVDEKLGTIHIRQGKGRDGGKDRTAYMTPQLQTILAAYRRARTALKPKAPTFFVDLRGQKAFGAGAMKGLFLTIQRKSQIRVSPHRLRHTYATLLRQAGVPDRVSMDLLGHSQITMLQRYSHVFEHEYPAEVKKLIL